MQPLVWGASLIFGSELALVLSGIMIREVSDSLPTAQIVFLRNLLALLWLLPWILRHPRKLTPGQRLPIHLLRAALGVSAMSCLFYAWAHLPLAQAAMLKQTAPFFLPFIALWWLKERIRSSMLISIFLGFVGIACILQPEEGRWHTAVFIGLLGAFLAATAKVSVRRLGAEESPQTIVVYFAILGSLFTALPAAWHWVPISTTDGLWLLGIAGLSTLAQLLMTRAYTLAPAGQLAAFTYSSVVFAALIGAIVWDEQINALTWIGMFIVCMAAALILYRRPSAAAVEPHRESRSR
ncbi:DMT family transporter [Nitrincola tapanii]|uniref:DMT family transporter n=1 Tax=Nitrincola tapanii TaxID=1708751 RepID=A0A5A9W3S2_9GAMM|nr:DMT family transporter [Nitrincola tapanii]KAA0875406.1 DMT family transporter [Nitrincola tapanii]